MITFDVGSIDRVEWRSNNWLQWMYENIGHGGRWLVTDGEVEPEPGDEWGYYFRGLGAYKVAILDEKKAELFALRWS